MPDETAHLAAALEAFRDRALVADDGFVTIKGGKEATVFRCRAGARSESEFLAAKVYRPLEVRRFKNDAVYQEGRIIGDVRLRRAYAKKTRSGRGVQFGLWLSHEYDVLRRLHAAGADVPRPVAMTGNTVLMEYIGDADAPAPLLKHVTLTPAEAQAFFYMVLWNVELFLKHNCVHGDLSEFNILYWQRRIKIIDFPQAVDPRVNGSALALLTHDLERICLHFARYGIRANPTDLATNLWARFLRAEL